MDVPLILQPKDSVDCGIASLAMILGYYDVPIEFKDLKEEICVDEVGTYSPQMGSFLLKRGFDVEIITMHPGLFTVNDASMAQPDIKDRLHQLSDSTKSEQDKKVLRFFIQFLEDGGRIGVRIPSKDDVVQEVVNKRPLGALLTTNFLTSSVPKFNFHFNVVTGIDDEFVYVNDPLWDDRGGKKKYRIQDFFYGLYASAYGDLDNASIMKIKKLNDQKLSPL